MTDTTDIGTLEQLVVAYFDMWRAAEPQARADLVERAFAPDGRHVDPMADAIGHEELAGMLANVHAAYPGFTIDRTSAIDQHGDQLRFAWTLRAADGTSVVDGLDVAEVSGDGRLGRVASFWGELPPR